MARASRRYVGNLPEQLAALNRTNINTQLLTIEAAVTRKREAIYHAALARPAYFRRAVDR